MSLVEKKKIYNSRLITALSTAMGDKIIEYMEDKKIIEIMLNPDGNLWIDKLGKGRENTNIKILPEEALRVINIVATHSNTVCNDKNPILSSELPDDGSRFQGMLPPVVANPSFTIRKKAILVYKLEDYLSQGILNQEQLIALKDGARNKKNVLVVGGTSSGKTTFCNAYLAEIATYGDRIIVIEDTQELQCSAPDTVYMRTSDEVDMLQLLKCTMRYRPDRIIVGEVRDGATALQLLKSWNSGHPGGCSTIHADNAQSGLEKLEQYISEETVTNQAKLISRTIDIVVYIEKTKESRIVKEVSFINGYDYEKNRYILTKI